MLLSRQRMKVDGRRVRAQPLSAAFALAWILASCGSEPTSSIAPERDAPLRAPSCELGELSAHPGSSVALAPRGIVLREDGAPKLLPLGADAGEPTVLDVLSVPPRGVTRRGAGWLALASTADGPALLVIGSRAEAGGRSVRRVALGAGALADGALVVRGDRAIATWVDEAGVARVARIDLLRDLATAPVVLDGSSGSDHVFASATAGGAVVAFAAPGAPLFEIRDTTATRRPAPG